MLQQVRHHITQENKENARGAQEAERAWEGRRERERERERNLDESRRKRDKESEEENF